MSHAVDISKTESGPVIAVDTTHDDGDPETPLEIGEAEPT